MDKLAKAIKGLECCNSGCCRGCPYTRSSGNGSCIDKSKRDALDLLKEKQPKWIPVDERLPEEDGHYLVCNHGFIPWIAELKTFRGIRGWCNGANMPVVKMWMPLPKTPKDGEPE